MRVLLFCGGRLGLWALSYIQKEDLIIGVDRGAYFLVENGLHMDVAIGDFDSVSDIERNQIRTHSSHFYECDPIEKDETDSEMAFQYALKQEPDEVLLIGAVGTRLDHSIANIHLLYKGIEHHVQCRIVDEYNEVYLVDDNLTIEKDHFEQVSLLPLSMEVTGITLEGFRYPLHNASLQIGHSLGISNVIKENKATIEVKTGYLMVIKSKD